MSQPKLSAKRMDEVIVFGREFELGLCRNWLRAVLPQAFLDQNKYVYYMQLDLHIV
jgi:hypothetical protein